MPQRLQAARVAWLNTKLTLDFIASSKAWIDDDLISALLVAGVVSANASTADPQSEVSKAPAIPGVLPDEVRRPVNALSLASSLGVPRESARGKLTALVERGVLSRTDDGFYLSAQVAASDPFRSAMTVFLKAIGEYIGGLAALGACGVRSGDRLTPTPWSVAGVATRLATAHVLRGIDLARSAAPEIGLTTHYIMLALSHLTGSALRVVSASSDAVGPLSMFHPTMGPVSVADIAKFTHVDDETVRRHVGQLEALGAIVRVGQKRDVNLEDEALIGRWLEFQKRTMAGTTQLTRKLYLADVIVDARSEALRSI